MSPGCTGASRCRVLLLGFAGDLVVLIKEGDDAVTASFDGSLSSFASLTSFDESEAALPAGS